MTPKEKALELYNKMYDSIGVRNREGTTGKMQALWIPERAKECVIAAIDEIISEGHLFFSGYKNLSRYDYWQKVKVELDKINEGEFAFIKKAIDEIPPETKAKVKKMLDDLEQQQGES
jgi:hypothetical protein